MKHSKALAAWLVISMIMFESYAYARDFQFNTSMRFRRALAITNPINIDFGAIEYTAGASGSITLAASNDNITCSNTTDYQCPATGTRGSFQMRGSNNNTVDISCDASGTLSNGTDTLTYDNVRAEIDGTEALCLGIGNSAIAYTFTNGSFNNVVSAGMTIQVGAGGVLSGGTYNTSNSGGDPISFRVVYQ